MGFDVSGVTGVLSAVLAGGSVVGAALLGARWAIAGWRILRDGDGGSGVTNFHWDQREGESYEEFYERNSRRDAGL